ncbi:unnamed protein product [Brachionus calyciflorus]|uniref:Uncharacterized protein n=1 Tax=Brachionus calyciflorus TaxID=104777 RepID=A0A814KH58_9BILA|nr:unnamed protein product [Brachionus calyciflorus]
MERSEYTSENISFHSYEKLSKKIIRGGSKYSRHCPDYAMTRYQYDCDGKHEEPKDFKFMEINRFEIVELMFANTGEVSSSLYTHFKNDKKVDQKALFDDLLELFKTYKDRCTIDVKIYLLRKETFYPNLNEGNLDVKITAYFNKLVYKITKNDVAKSNIKASSFTTKNNV